MRTGKQSAFTIRRTNPNPSELGFALAEKAALMSVSAPSDTHAVVILVVEDDLFTRCDIAACLHEAGYVVLEAASGEEATALCKSGVPIDIVFTDINLGGSASGWDVAECFRTRRSNALLLYTSGQAIDPQRCVPDGAVVAKPYQHVDILSVRQRLEIR